MRRALLAVALLLAAWPARPQPLPVGTRSLYLLDVPFLHLAPVAFAPAGKLEISFEAAYGNTFSHTWHAGAIQYEFGTYGAPFSRQDAETLHTRHPQDVISFLDGEVTRFSLRGAMGLTPEIGLAVEVPVVSWSALHLDSAIESFHDAVGLAGVSRQDRPRGRFEIVRQRPGGPLEFDDRTPASGLSDVSLSGRYRRTLSGGTRLAVDAVVKLPTGDADAYRGSGSLDVGLLAGAAHTIGRLGLRLEAGVVRPGRFHGDVPTSFQVTAFTRLLLGADLRLGRRTYVSLSALREDSPFRNDPVGDGAKASGEVVLGLSRELGRKGWALLSLTENLPAYGDAADVVIQLSFGVRP